MSDTQAVLEGLISVRAALQAGSRPIHVIYLRADKRDRDAAQLAREAQDAGVPVERVPAAVLEQHVQGKTHGGVIALVGPRRFVSLEALGADSDRPFIVMLDGVEDPYNFGQAVRAFYAAGADGMVLRPRNWMSAAGIVARASAGASELLPAAVSETAEEAAAHFRRRGLIVACADKDRAVSLYDADLTVGLFLLVGGEKRGVTRSFADRADLRLRIPYGRRFPQALDTTSAAAVLAFEIMRQRGTMI
nr:MAG: RNA methyltransferase [Chloroflexota bacterium]